MGFLYKAMTLKSANFETLRRPAGGECLFHVHEIVYLANICPKVLVLDPLRFIKLVLYLFGFIHVEPLCKAALLNFLIFEYREGLL